MDASEKIVRFDTYEELLNEIRRDMHDADPLRCRYPVRFIMLNNFDVFTKLAQDLAHEGIGALNIEDLLKKDDGWITTDDLSKAIRSLKSPTLVTPFSELVRFYDSNDFRGFFNEIMLIEDIDNPTKRIYIPLIGLQNRFEIFLNGFARIDESEPVWCYSAEEQKTDVFLTKFKSDSNTFAHKAHICCLNTMRDWLRFWKNQAPQTQIICSSGPIYRRCKFSDPDNIFTFKYIESAYEYIESFLGISIPVYHESTEDKYWEQLLTDIVKTGPSVFNFSTFVLNQFNVRILTPDVVLRHWVLSESSEYEKWLIKNSFLNSNASDKFPYFTLCLNECSDYANLYELVQKVAERIFYFSESSTQRAYAEERNSIITYSASIFNEFVPDDTKRYIKDRMAEIDQKDTSLAISLCSGAFGFEKVLCSAWYSNRDKNGFTYGMLENKFQELAKYFSTKVPSVKNGSTWHMDYLNEYREAKLSDCLSDKIKDYISEYNHDSDSFYQWYHSFEESHNRLASHETSEQYHADKVYWIDALGSEFMPFILAQFDDGLNGYNVIYSEITRSTIPSATAQNRFEEIIKVSELDELAHDKSGYKKYETLIRELRLLQSIIWDITINNFSGEHTIAIVSDHGLSALSRCTDSKKYDAKVEHDGRYIKVPKDTTLYHDSDYVVHTNENDGERYKVALTHASLGRKPIHEVHGGCTPEEVLVPYIVISNRKQNLTKYVYTLLTKEIEVSNPVVTVNIMPQPSKVKLTIDGRDYFMTRSGSKWSARIDGIEEGEHKLAFSILGGTTHNDTIKVNGTGFGGNDFLDF